MGTDEDEARTGEEDPEVFLSVLSEAVEVLESHGIDHLIIGSLAAITFGIPRQGGDIDLFVRPRDAGTAQRVLADAAFEPEHTDLPWLEKVRKQGVLIDLIFEIQKKMHLEDVMLQRSALRELGGLKLRVIPPEDFIVMQAASHSETTPHYWGNGLGTLVQQKIDWDYLIERAQHSARRVLSLLVYAQADDILVPDAVVKRLFTIVYGEADRDAR